MNTPHPISGPISPEELQRLADAPYGQAAVELRKHDPLFGRKDGEKIEWLVRLTARCNMEAYTTVEASSEKEALDIAATKDGNSFDWEPADYADYIDFDAESAKPK